MLQFESLAAADPVVVAGAAGLTRPVRWVHVSELVDIAGHLRGQEMILTTGIALPEHDEGLRAYIAALAEVDVAAVIVGLGPHFDRTLPVAMMEAADEHAIPLVVLRRHTAFVVITEDVHARLVDDQIDQLQQSVQIHETMRTLAIHGSSAKEILDEAARLSGRPVVLEDLRHELLEVAEGPRSRNDVTTEWSEHTKRHRATRRTDYDPRTGWLTTTVGLKGDDWARLIIMSAADASLPRGLEQDPLSLVQPTLTMLIERVASTIALGRLVARDRGTLGRQTHLDILSGLMSGGRAAEEAAELARAMGFPMSADRLGAVCATIAQPTLLTAREREDLAHSAAAAIRTRCVRNAIPFLLAEVRPGCVLALISGVDGMGGHLLDGMPEASRNRFATGLANRIDGSTSAGDVLTEACQTAEIARILDVTGRAVTRSELGLEGLLLSLRHDSRVERFAADSLEKLRAQDPQLIDALRVFLFSGRNKSLAAKRAFVSRQWLYEQLDRVERLLEISLDDEATCLRLQVAILHADLADRAERFTNEAGEEPSSAEPPTRPGDS